jgi:rhodanese-related sulfurtransferase
MQFVLNNWHLFFALGVILAMLATKPIIMVMYGIKTLNPAQAVQVVNREDGVIVDVCEPAEYNTGHIVNAVNLPLSALAGRAGELDKHRSRPVIVSCRSGNRSIKGAVILRKRGFEKVYSLAGGLVAWQQSNLPVEK